MARQRRAHGSEEVGEDRIGFWGMVAPDMPLAAANTEEDMRALAYSQTCAAALAKDLRADIASFRRILPYGRVLAPPNMLDWILDMASGEVPTLWPRDVPLVRAESGDLVLPHEKILELLEKRPPGDEPREHEWTLKEEPRLEHKYLRFIQWGTEERGWAPVQSHGALDWARRLAVRLVDAIYRWGEVPGKPRSDWELWGLSRAATFVLTGYVPLIRPSQIPLPPGKGIRPQTPKHLQLAVFAAQQRDLSVRARIDIWNQRYREWAYRTDAAFTRDSSQAIRRLLNSPEGSEVAAADGEDGEER